MKYTSRDMSRKSIQKHYHETIENDTDTTCDVRTYSGTPSKLPMKIKKLTIAYSCIKKCLTHFVPQPYTNTNPQYQKSLPP